MEQDGPLLVIWLTLKGEKATAASVQARLLSPAISSESRFRTIPGVRLTFRGRTLRAVLEVQHEKARSG
jgi:hypothetical protein